jgi:D-alanyl-D-alanine dipeptidase
MTPTPVDYVIDIIDLASNAGSYNNVPFDADDKRAADPLVRLADFGIAGESFYARVDGKNWPYYTRIEGSLPDIWARELVAKKLKRVNELIRQHGVELYVWDAYRSIDCQRGIWKFFSDQATRHMPTASADEKKQFVLNYVSDPTRFVRSDSRTWPAHTSGGAVDLTLRSLRTLELCDMGARFDEMDDISHSHYFEGELENDRSPQTDIVRSNRRLLHWGMSQEGFVNYPLEFWHFDWGNQMYVSNLRMTGKSAPAAAWYGYIDPPK